MTLRSDLNTKLPMLRQRLCKISLLRLRNAVGLVKPQSMMTRNSQKIPAETFVRRFTVRFSWRPSVPSLAYCKSVSINNLITKPFP